MQMKKFIFLRIPFVKSEETVIEKDSGDARLSTVIFFVHADQPVIGTRAGAPKQHRRWM